MSKKCGNLVGTCGNKIISWGEGSLKVGKQKSCGILWISWYFCQGLVLGGSVVVVGRSRRTWTVELYWNYSLQKKHWHTTPNVDLNDCSCIIYWGYIIIFGLIIFLFLFSYYYLSYIIIVCLRFDHLSVEDLNNADCCCVWVYC